MRSFIKAAVLLSSLMSFPGLSQTNPTTPAPPIPWSKIIWDSTTLGGKVLQHSALMVEVKLDSLATPGLMQLDTGADRDALYSKIYERLHPTETPGDKNWISLSGTVAGRTFKGDWFYHLRDFEDSADASKLPVIGTIGLGFFERRILLIDFVSQQVGILRGNQDLPPAIAQKVDFVPIEFRDGKIFIAVTINGAEDRLLFFDSGSSAMPVMTSRPRWLELTGAQPDDPSNSITMGTSWGKPARYVGAPLKGSMCVGKACLPHPLAFFESTGLGNLDFDKYPYKASGNFGNVLFDGRYTVIVDLPHKRFGLFEGSISGLPQ
jgi:hypothetical protein